MAAYIGAGNLPRAKRRGADVFATVEVIVLVWPFMQ
jgi:hypothetical protein